MEHTARLFSQLQAIGDKHLQAAEQDVKAITHVFCKECGGNADNHTDHWCGEYCEDCCSHLCDMADEAWQGRGE